MLDSLAAFETEDLLKVTLLLVIVLLAIEIVAAIVGFVGLIIGGLFGLSGIVSVVAFMLLTAVVLTGLRTFGAL